jgi:5-methylcytosine-specific restriction protein A
LLPFWGAQRTMWGRYIPIYAAGVGDGMAKDWAKAFYKSAAWLKCRAAYIAERVALDGGLCEECQEQLGHIVHHKILLTPANITDPDVALNHDLLKYVCKRCHDYEEAHFVNKDDCRCRFDASGQPVEVAPPF